MQAVQYTVRRANLDDLPVLVGLWRVAGLAPLELEKHLTEFYVALRPDGVLVGVVGLRAADGQGLVYGEAFASPRQGEETRAPLWERLQVMARSRAVARLWVREGVCDWWQEQGFKPATPQEIKRLPRLFGPVGGGWLTFALRDETVLPAALNEEFARLQEEARAHNERLRRQASLLKWVAAAIAAVFFAGTLWLLLELLNRRPAPALPP
jgi:N-acetylglutamate synthase-like GNAT family acetyltransferase